MHIKRHEGHEREFPHAHIYHALLPIIFMAIWFLDSQIFHITTILNEFIPLIVRFPLFIIILIIAITFILVSHRVLFHSHQPPDSLITTGIMSYVRNPMYFGILLIYIAFIAYSISLISIVLFFLVFLVYNKMVNFEESILEEKFSDQYIEYKNKVPKWIPNLFKK